MFLRFVLAEPIENPPDGDQPGAQRCTKENRSPCQSHCGLDPPQTQVETSVYLERSIRDERHSLSPNRDQILTNRTQRKRKDGDGGQLSGPTRVSPPNNFASWREMWWHHRGLGERSSNEHKENGKGEWEIEDTPVRSAQNAFTSQVIWRITQGSTRARSRSAASNAARDSDRAERWLYTPGSTRGRDRSSAATVGGASVGKATWRLASGRIRRKEAIGVWRVGKASRGRASWTHMWRFMQNTQSHWVL